MTAAYAKVQAVVFDAVGTVLRPARPVAQIYQQAAARQGICLEQSEIRARFEHAFARQEALDADEGSWRTSEARERQRWRQIVGEVFEGSGAPSGIDRLFEDLWHRFAVPDTWTLYDDVADTWQRLAAAGITLGVASNMDERLRKIGTALPPLDTCLHWFVSSELGVRKPGGEFFAAVQQRLRLRADELLLVGDDVENDFKAAQACGWHAILVDRAAATGHPEAVSTLESVTALLAPNGESDVRCSE